MLAHFPTKSNFSLRMEGPEADLTSLPIKKARYDGLVDHTNPDMISLGVLAELDRKLCSDTPWHGLNGDSEVMVQGGRSSKAKVQEKEAKESTDNADEKKEKVFIIPHNKLEEGCAAGAYWYKWLIKHIGKVSSSEQKKN